MTMTYCAYLGCKAGPQFIVDPEHSETPVCGRHLTGKVRELLAYGSTVGVMDFYAFDQRSGIARRPCHQTVQPGLIPCPNCDHSSRSVAPRRDA